MIDLLLIGDVHGKMNEYRRIIENSNHDFSIQVGDFGFQKEWTWLEQESGLDPYHNKIIHGNHDCIPMARTSPYSLGRYYFYPDHSIFCMAGASSIDRSRRVEGRDWFRDEELSYSEFREIYDFYLGGKPDIVISHDCPQIVCTKLFGIKETNNTRQSYDWLLGVHRPKLWVFGHHHNSVSMLLDGTYFICLDELETLRLKI
jgi:hypothetical protein